MPAITTRRIAIAAFVSTMALPLAAHADDICGIYLVTEVENESTGMTDRGSRKVEMCTDSLWSGFDYERKTTCAPLPLLPLEEKYKAFWEKMTKAFEKEGYTLGRDEMGLVVKKAGVTYNISFDKAGAPSVMHPDWDVSYTLTTSDALGLEVTESGPVIVADAHIVADPTEYRFLYLFKGCP